MLVMTWWGVYPRDGFAVAASVRPPLRLLEALRVEEQDGAQHNTPIGAAQPGWLGTPESPRSEGVQSKTKWGSSPRSNWCPGRPGLSPDTPGGMLRLDTPGGYAALISKLNKRSLTALNKIRVCLLSS